MINIDIPEEEKEAKVEAVSRLNIQIEDSQPPTVRKIEADRPV